MKPARHGALESMRSILAARSPHAVRCVVLTDPAGKRCLELRRIVDGTPLLARGGYSAVVLAACMAEGVEVVYRAVAQMPRASDP